MYLVPFFCLPICIELLYRSHSWVFLTEFWILKCYFFRPAVTSVLTLSRERSLCIPYVSTSACLI